jgi:flavin reductase (DIM6/NTAB) family NADH-FMN oxidoreductase RutF
MSQSAIASLFQCLSQGVYVVGVAGEGCCNAFTAAWVMQVSFDPPMLALGINPHHRSYGLLEQGKAFSVNVLKKDQLELAAHYAEPASADKLALVDWVPGHAGVPLLNDALAWFECQWAGECPVGDHVLVWGRVVGGKILDAAAEPMLYRDTGAMDGAAALFPDKLG